MTILRLHVTQAHNRQVARRALWTPAVGLVWAGLRERLDDPDADAELLAQDMAEFVDCLFGVEVQEADADLLKRAADEPRQQPVAPAVEAPASDLVVASPGALLSADPRGEPEEGDS